MVFPPNWTAPPTAPEWTPFQALRAFPGSPIGLRAQAAQEVKSWDCWRNCPSSGPGAGYGPLQGVGKERSPGAGTFQRWEPAQPLASPDPITAPVPRELPLRGRGARCPSRTLAFNLKSYSFGFSRACLSLPQNEAAPWRCRSGEDPSPTPPPPLRPGLQLGRRPALPPSFYQAGRRRESPRGSSHPRGFSPVASDFALRAQLPGAAFL